MMQATAHSPARVEVATAAVGPSQTATVPASTAEAWWRHPMVWLVIMGPVAVVVAGFWTLWLAITYPDPVVSASPNTMQANGDAHTLAQTARNHAATSRAKP